MGFDLYGLKPNNPDEAIRPEQLDWSKKHTQKAKDKYFKSVDEYEEEVVGHYFRNNVWFWRPLWGFVIASCGDILTDNDAERGSYNEGHRISKTKAIRISKRLSKIDNEGVLEEMQKTADEQRKKADKHNKIVREEMDAVTKACKKEHGESIVPANYPEPYKTQWEDAFAKEDWHSNYPFSADNVRDFAEFCENSGGFEIC